MQIIPIMPIETMFGMVNRRAGYYIRRSPTGKLYSCRCPDRSRHVKTPAESANQQRFAARYAGHLSPPFAPCRTYLLQFPELFCKRAMPHLFCSKRGRPYASMSTPSAR